MLPLSCERGSQGRDCNEGDRVKEFGGHVPALTFIPIPTLWKRDAEGKDARSHNRKRPSAFFLGAEY